MAKIKDIKLFHKFKISLDIWVSNTNTSSYIYLLKDECYYEVNAPEFIYGVFINIRIFSKCLRIKIKWWQDIIK